MFGVAADRRGTFDTLMTRHRIIAGFIALLAIGACSAMSSIGPVDPPARSSFDAALIARGAQLAAIGNCNVCHTAPGGKPYAGGAGA